MDINLSNQDIFKFILFYWSIIFSYQKFGYFLTKIFIFYTFIFTFLMWEMSWSINPNFCIYWCNNSEKSLSYYERAISCKIDTKNITKPNILHAISNSASDVFLMIIIFFISIKYIPYAFTKNVSYIEQLKFLLMCVILGISQNSLLDAINFFPKQCCYDHINNICPMPYSLIGCQNCDNNATICLSTNINWIITPIFIYYVSRFYLLNSHRNF